MSTVITVKSLHRQLNEVFRFPCPISTSCVSKAIQSQARFALKLMHYERDDCDNEERLKERIRVVSNPKLNCNRVDVVYMDEVGYKLTRRPGRAH